ncbi:interleukin-1 receptor accessory protein-like isoform X2 [Myripristis murdjan]|uniref:interleukin-1 receptor accessory protein-like isoform X2 n=1 Tax=Myripristis murdjan TaxID=586833 RepID=UPI0011760045|nr:interleukin-1 receptor accessory protein-like isoform X2 [Myripristis murdjan]
MKLTHILKEDSPEIIGPHRIQMRACPGKRLVLNCKAYANCEEDLTLIYWLVNGSFPETAYTNGRVAETEESTLDGGAILQRSLVLKNVTPEDLKSTFTCVVTNPAGTAHKYVTLKPARSKFRAHRA